MSLRHPIPFMCQSCHTNERVTSHMRKMHIRMSHITHMNVSRDIFEECTYTSVGKVYVIWGGYD